MTSMRCEGYCDETIVHLKVLNIQQCIASYNLNLEIGIS